MQLPKRLQEILAIPAKMEQRQKTSKLGPAGNREFSPIQKKFEESNMEVEQSLQFAIGSKEKQTSEKSPLNAKKKSKIQLQEQAQAPQQVVERPPQQQEKAQPIQTPDGSGQLSDKEEIKLLKKIVAEQSMELVKQRKQLDEVMEEVKKLKAYFA